MEEKNKRKLGSQKEALAAGYLEAQGCRILEKNYRNRRGEIDLILEDGGFLVFAEVKYRSTERNGLPEEAVDIRKQQKIRSVACSYLAGRSADIPCRLDVISILGGKIRWIKDAF